MTEKKIRQLLAYPIDLEGCSRCGESHKNLVFKEFINPQIVGKDEENPDYVFNHWVMCPNTNEPIMIALDVSVKDGTEIHEREL